VLLTGSGVIVIILVLVGTGVVFPSSTSDWALVA
jgi:hypothetical protein